MSFTSLEAHHLKWDELQCRFRTWLAWATRPEVLFIVTRVGVKYFSKYLSQVQVLFHICKYKYKFKYSEYLEDIKYIKYFFNQVQVKYKYFGNKQ